MEEKERAAERKKLIHEFGLGKRLTRKDVASVADVTIYQVRSNERRWGLDRCRFDLNSRCVRYDRAQALDALEAHGLLPYQNNSGRLASKC
jgi:hypothetical protein